MTRIYPPNKALQGDAGNVNYFFAITGNMIYIYFWYKLL
jgi:hypothetical protein